MASFLESLGAHLAHLVDRAEGPLARSRHYAGRDFTDLVFGVLFDPGGVTVTPRAGAALRQAGVSVRLLMVRHLTGDWGDGVSNWERGQNEAALAADRGTFLSRYPLATGDVIEILTLNGPRHTWVGMPGD